MSEPDYYNIRDFVPDFDAIAAEFTARSDAMTARTVMRADLAYGSRPREVLDIIFPEHVAQGAPLHVFIHGGYWRSGEKSSYRFVAEPVLAAGGIAALVEYDLMPGARLPLLVDQVRRAVLWLQQNARFFGYDPKRITASGHSAGAHLCSYLAATSAAETAPPTLPDVRGMLLLSGIYDLSEIPGSFLKHEAQMTLQEADAWSPVDASHHHSVDRIIAYGSEETQPFHEQAAALDGKLRADNQPTRLLPLRGLNHMSVVLELGNPEGELGRAIADLANNAAARPPAAYRAKTDYQQ